MLALAPQTLEIQQVCIHFNVKLNLTYYLRPCKSCGLSQSLWYMDIWSQTLW